MKSICVFALLIFVPFSLVCKEPEVDDWGINDDGSSCRACVTVRHSLPNGVTIYELKCGSPEKPGMYKTKCNMVENICVLEGDNCFYNL